MRSNEPMFNVPAGVTVFVVAFVLVHLVRWFVDPDTSTWLLLASAFIPARYAGEAMFIPGGETATVTSFITHIFTHIDVMHLAINSAWMLAFGSVLARRNGFLPFVAFTLAGGCAGALGFLIMHQGEAVPVVGASGAIAAQMAAVLRILFPALDAGQGRLLRENPRFIPLMPLAQALTDRRVILATLAFIGINLLAFAGINLADPGGAQNAGGIAWEAHLGGYAFGLLCYGLFDFAVRNQEPGKPELH